MLVDKIDFEYRNCYNFVELTKDEQKVVKKIINFLWKEGSEIMGNGRQLMTNAEKISIEHHDGKICFNDWGYAQMFSRSKEQMMITTWYNTTITKKQMQYEIEEFCIRCKAHNLPIIFN